MTAAAPPNEALQPSCLQPWGQPGQPHPRNIESRALNRTIDTGAVRQSRAGSGVGAEGEARNNAPGRERAACVNSGATHSRPAAASHPAARCFPLTIDAVPHLAAGRVPARQRRAPSRAYQGLRRLHAAEGRLSLPECRVLGVRHAPGSGQHHAAAPAHAAPDVRCAVPVLREADDSG
jgi:hypothetical protein